MNITIARHDAIDAMYVDGILKRQAHIIDVDDVLIYAGRQPHTLKKVYINEEWVKQVGYILPANERDLVLEDE